MNRLTAEQVIEHLGLQPLVEGGYFVETYCSSEMLSNLPERYVGPRSMSTAIYFLLTSKTVSKLHRLKSDEVWHFYQGDAVELVQFKAGDTCEVIRLGHDLLRDEHGHALVPYGTWQGARLVEGGSWALMGSNVAPGFEFFDFELAKPGELLRTHPSCKTWIEKLT